MEKVFFFFFSFLFFSFLSFCVLLLFFFFFFFFFFLTFCLASLVDKLLQSSDQGKSDETDRFGTFRFLFLFFSFFFFPFFSHPSKRLMDHNDLERERGITIMAKYTSLTYTRKSGETAKVFFSFSFPLSLFLSLPLLLFESFSHFFSHFPLLSDQHFGYPRSW